MSSQKPTIDVFSKEDMKADKSDLDFFFSDRAQLALLSLRVLCMISS